MRTEEQEIEELQKTEKLFSFVQTLTAAFAAFVHGSNNVGYASSTPL